MTRKQRWRYYCDFCGKAGGAGGHIARHEKGCTANPNRECGLHKRIGEPQPPLADLIGALESGGEDWAAGLSALIDASGECPTCILAALRQSPKLKATRDRYWTESPLDNALSPLEQKGLDTIRAWNFKAKMAKWWRDVNGAEYERGMQYL